VHLKMDKVDLKKKKHEKYFFANFCNSPIK
jgi:hypothetical protein